MGGFLTVAAFSSVLRSVVIPALSDLVRASSSLVFEFMLTPTSEIPRLVERRTVQFGFGYEPLAREGVESLLLGYETNLLVQSSSFESRADFYVDQRFDDHFTEEFFVRSGMPIPLMRRAFAADVYGILDSVALGLGRGLAPWHLVRNDSRLAIVPDSPPLRLPVHLYFAADGAWRPIVGRVIETLRSKSPRLLSPPDTSGA
jgi:DNA-binding transcriptional LysR family regulator